MEVKLDNVCLWDLRLVDSPDIADKRRLETYIPEDILQRLGEFVPVTDKNRIVVYDASTNSKYDKSKFNFRSKIYMDVGSKYPVTVNMSFIPSYSTHWGIQLSTEIISPGKYEIRRFRDLDIVFNTMCTLTFKDVNVHISSTQHMVEVSYRSIEVNNIAYINLLRITHPSIG